MFHLIKGRIAWFIHDIKCGRHSNFPACCVATWTFVHFVNRWNWAYEDPDDDEGWRRQSRGTGYRECPWCLSKPVELRKIGKCEDHRPAASRFMDH